MGSWARIGLPALLFFSTMGAFGYYGSRSNSSADSGLLLLGAAVGAEARLRDVLAENPADIEAWMELGDLYQEHRRLAEALDAYERAVLLAADDVTPELRAVLVQIRLGHVESAETRALALLGSRPVDSSVIKVLAWIDIHRALENAAGLEGLSPDPERLTRAEQRFSRVLRIEPRDAEAFLGLAVAAKLGRRDIQALEYADEAVRHDSGLYWPWQLRGQVLADLGRDSEARDAFLEARARDAGRPYTLMDLAALARREERPADAASFMAGIGAEGAYHRGVDLWQAGRPAEAEQAFLSALLADPEDDVALDRLERIRIELYPSDDTRRLGLAERRIQKAARAENVNNMLLAYLHYRRAVSLAPQVSSSRLRMARFYDRQGAFADAVTQLRRVEELTRSQTERLAASDLLEVITRKALTEMESTHAVNFGALWEQSTGILGDLVGNPEVLEERIRWSVTPVARPRIRIAILPFIEAMAPFHVGTGRLAAEWMGRTLELLPGFEVVSLADVDAALARRGATGALGVDPGTIGRDLGAQLVVRGRLLEAREDVSLRLEAVIVPHGPVAWSQEYAIRGAEALTRAVLEATRALAWNAPLEGAVVRRLDRAQVTVNLGRVHGVRVGDTLVFERRAQELLAPGFDWPGQRVEAIAEGRVTGLTERYAEVRLVGIPVAGGAAAPVPVRAGDAVRVLRNGWKATGSGARIGAVGG